MILERMMWARAREHYAWDVDLRHFKHRRRHPGHFNRVIGPKDVTDFEDTFRRALHDGGPYEVAGEVCFWKNYGSYQSRDRTTQRLLGCLSQGDNWAEFVTAVKQLCSNPTYLRFKRLQEACGQPRGFATPITFLAFYDPASYPMIDKHIGDWWGRYRRDFGCGRYSEFSQRKDGWIETTSDPKTMRNWRAYLAWARFCRDYAQRIGESRARDVEMSVWTAQKHGLPLHPLSR